jgi:hypothetical protein
MTLDTQMTLALLQELLMALRANDADGYKGWLALGIEELGNVTLFGPPGLPENLRWIGWIIDQYCSYDFSSAKAEP